MGIHCYQMPSHCILSAFSYFSHVSRHQHSLTFTYSRAVMTSLMNPVRMIACRPYYTFSPCTIYDFSGNDTTRTKGKTCRYVCVLTNICVSSMKLLSFPLDVLEFGHSYLYSISTTKYINMYN